MFEEKEEIEGAPKSQLAGRETGCVTKKNNEKNEKKTTSRIRLKLVNGKKMKKK